MGFYPRNNLGRHFAFSLAGVVAGVMLVVSLGVIVHRAKTVEARLRKRLADASKLAETTLPAAVWQFNDEYVSDFVESLFLDDQVVFVEVVTSDRTIKSKVRPEAAFMIFEPLAISPEYATQVTMIRHRGAPIGEVRIAVTRAPVRMSVLRDSATSIALMAATIGAIAVTTLVISRRHVFAPLEDLERTASLIASGNMDAAIDTSGAGEIGQLAGTLDLMVKNLRKVTASRDELDREVGERRRAEEEARRLARFPSENPNPVLRVDGWGRILYANDGGAQLLRDWGCVVGDRLPPEYCQLNSEALDKGETETVEVACNGRVFSLAFAPVPEAGFTNLYGLDITSRKQAEDRLRASLAEKEVLLREVHHRVKNNLQIISSLLRLQARELDDGRLTEMLADSQKRITAMALVHDSLYRAADLARVDFAGYIRSLARELYRAYGAEARRILFRLTAEDVTLSIDKAAPCGQILSELISNSLKHAFQQDTEDEKRIEVRLRTLDDGMIELAVADNGVGMPAGLDVGASQSLGLRLVTMLAEDQLDGTVESHDENGACIQIRFPRG